MTELWDDVDEIIEEIAERILVEVQDSTVPHSARSAFAKIVSQLSDVEYMERMLKTVDDASRKSVCDLEKREVIKGLIFVTWLQRMYSTIRSLLLGLVAIAFLLPVLLLFGSLDILQNVLIFFPIFVSGLIITRLLDNQIIKATKKTVRFLSKHKKLRDFVMDNF
jgi:hypothetical protein